MFRKRKQLTNPDHFVCRIICWKIERCCTILGSYLNNNNPYCPCLKSWKKLLSCNSTEPPYPLWNFWYLGHISAVFDLSYRRLWNIGISDTLVIKSPKYLAYLGNRRYRNYQNFYNLHVKYSIINLKS
jgi:hypothetical protein